MSDAIDKDNDRGVAGRAIVTFARGWQSLVVTRSLGRHGVEVITGDEYAMTPGSLSRFAKGEFRYPSPSDDPEGFVDTLEQVVRENKPEDPSIPYVLIPVHKESYVIAEHRHRFEPYIRVPLPELEKIERVHNKGSLAQWAIERQLPIPRTWLPESVEELRRSADDIVLPVFVKLRESAAGVGVQKVSTLEELEETFVEFIDHFDLRGGELPIIQEAVPGDDYCVTTLFDRGKLLASMTYHNLRAFPPEKGAGVMRETVAAPEMESIAATVLGPLEWHGVAQLDFRWDGKEATTPSLIEVNPRFWGGLIQAVESGWDYPWLLFQLAAGRKVEAPQGDSSDVRTETPLVALLATLQELADNEAAMDELKEAWHVAERELKEGSKRAALKALLGGVKEAFDMKSRLEEMKRLFEQHRGNVYDILASDDPLPALGVLYPVAVFLRHGKVNMELLTGETGPRARDDA